MPSAPLALAIGSWPSSILAVDQIAWKVLVEAEPRIDVARKFVRRGDDRLQRRADESVAMRLAAGQRAGVAAKEGQVRREFLAKRHVRCNSSKSIRRRLLGGQRREMQPRDGRATTRMKAGKTARPRPRAKVEQSAEFFVSNPMRAAYSRPPTLCVCSAGRQVPGLLWQAWKHGRPWPRGVMSLTLPAKRKASARPGTESAARTSHLAPEQTRPQADALGRDRQCAAQRL